MRTLGATRVCLIGFTMSELVHHNRSHREGMHTNFTLQACQVPEHLRGEPSVVCTEANHTSEHYVQMASTSTCLYSNR